MPLETLSDKLQMSLRRLTGRGKLNENDIDEAMREIRVALLEADVNYRIVKKFIAEIKEEALGERVMKSLTPGDQVVKIVYEHLVSLMGEEAAPINLKESGLSVILMCGLQGSGKTTHAAKIASYLRKNNNLRPLLIAADVYRPAAINQLVQLGKQLDIEVFELGSSVKPQEIVKKGIAYAKDTSKNLVIIDTAGRLQIDENLMEELENIENTFKPHETLLVIDSMMGQDAINVITGFNEKLSLTGVVLTKLDGDTRGGVALSVRHLTNIPIKFVGVSEKMDGLSEFHPDRMASRILGMGDILSLVEKVSSEIDEKDAESMVKKMTKGDFDLEDFLTQLKQIKKMGPLENLLKLLPGAKKMGLTDIKIDPKQMAHTEAIVLSMTPYERKHPEILKASRKQRIAKGSGRTVTEVNQLLKQFEEMKKMMKLFGNGKFKFPF